MPNGVRDRGLLAPRRDQCEPLGPAGAVIPLFAFCSAEPACRRQASAFFAGQFLLRDELIGLCGEGGTLAPRAFLL